MAQVASLEEDNSQNVWDDITDHELSVDITDGASSPNQITSSVPSLTPEEEYVYYVKQLCIIHINHSFNY